jgi:hypothetical protein
MAGPGGSTGGFRFGADFRRLRDAAAGLVVFLAAMVLQH